jgi:hypothetical protein
VTEHLPEQYQVCLTALDTILKHALEILETSDDNREKLQAMSLAKKCYSMKLDLLTNATVVDDAIRFVSQKSKENLKSSTDGDNEESNEPDYDEDELGEGQEENTTREIALASKKVSHIVHNYLNHAFISTKHEFRLFNILLAASL